MTKLTEMQTAILNAFPLNYDSAEAEIADNATYTDVAELAEATGLSKKQAKSCLASLSKRGLVATDEENCEGDILQCLTDEGINAVYELRPAVEKKPEKNQNTASELPTKCEGTNKQVADFLYTRAGMTFVLAGGHKLKVSKLAVWNELTAKPDEACGLRAEFADGEYHLKAI